MVEVSAEESTLTAGCGCPLLCLPAPLAGSGMKDVLVVVLTFLLRTTASFAGHDSTALPVRAGKKVTVSTISFTVGAVVGLQTVAAPVSRQQ